MEAFHYFSNGSHGFFSTSFTSLYLFLYSPFNSLLFWYLLFPWLFLTYWVLVKSPGCHCGNNTFDRYTPIFYTVGEALRNHYQLFISFVIFYHHSFSLSGYLDWLKFLKSKWRIHCQLRYICDTIFVAFHMGRSVWQYMTGKLCPINKNV